MPRQRRAKGSGSISRRSDGRWAAQIDLGLRDGRRWRPRAILPTERAARQWLAQQAHDRDRGQAPPGRELTGPFLTRWLETVQALHVAPATYSNQSVVVRVHLLPAFGHIPLAKLTPSAIQDYVARKAAAGAAPGSLRKHLATLHSALETAVDWELLARNPARRIRLPKVPERDASVLDWEAAARFLAVVASDRLAALYVVGIATGLRIGECLGLQWAAVDLDAGVLRVERKLLRLSKANSIEEPPKTPRSRRTVELVPWAVVALRRHKVRQAEERLLLGEAWERPDLVFTNPLGGLLWAHTVSTVWLPRLCAQAGLPRMTFHGLRKSFATLLLSDGADVAAVSSLLGHADASITYRAYRKLLPGERRGAVDRLGRLGGNDEGERAGPAPAR